MAPEQQSLPVEPLPQTPNLPGAVSDTRDGITIDSNTGTTDELSKTLDALDTAIEKHEDGQSAPVEREDKTGRFTSKQRRSNPVARMEEATAREAQAKREAAEAKAETQRLREQLTQRSQPVPPQPQQQVQPRAPQPPPDPEPDAADAATYPAGEFDPRYLRDIGRWEARQEYQKQRAADSERQRFDHHIKTVETGLTTYAQRMKASFTEPDGLDKHLKELPPALVNLRPTQVQNIMTPGAPLTAGNVIADAVVESDQPVALTTYLKDHPQELQRLLALHPMATLREMGRLDERIAAAAAPSRTAPRDPVSRARPPVQRVESVPQMSDDPPGEHASDEEHVAYYNRKELARRYGRG
jgi:hypothetical protein